MLVRILLRVTLDGMVLEGNLLPLPLEFFQSLPQLGAKFTDICPVNFQFIRIAQVLAQILLCLLCTIM